MFMFESYLPDLCLTFYFVFIFISNLSLMHQEKTQNAQEKHKYRLKKKTHQVSLIILHARCSDQVVLLPPPVPEATEEIIGQKAVDGVSDYIDVDGLFYPEPETKRNTILHNCHRRSISVAATPYLLKLRKWTCRVQRNGGGILLMFLMRSTFGEKTRMITSCC